MVYTKAITEYFLLELLSPATISPPPYPNDLEALLATFSDVFVKPLGLPPVHSHDHAIQLLLHTSAVQVHP